MEISYSDTVKVHCCVVELMSRQILEQITAGESFNTRRIDLEIFINRWRSPDWNVLYWIIPLLWSAPVSSCSSTSYGATAIPPDQCLGSCYTYVRMPVDVTMHDPNGCLGGVCRSWLLEYHVFFHRLCPGSRKVPTTAMFVSWWVAVLPDLEREGMGNWWRHSSLGSGLSSNRYCYHS